jgi:deoxyribodipyrimidine photolyase-like uncharacterized protein
MKVTVLLRNDHEMLRDLIEKFQKTPMHKQGMTLFQEIRMQIKVHSQMASEIFYSALSATPSDRAVALVATAEKRCEAVESLFQELNRMKPEDPGFESKMKKVIAEIDRHIEMEEAEMFHEARKALPEYRLEELGLEMQARRDSLKVLAVS